MPEVRRLKVLALVPPKETRVGHWACSSASLEVRRIILEGIDLPARIKEAFADFHPDALAMMGKGAREVNDLLDRLAEEMSGLGGCARVFRCQNTALSQRFGNGPHSSRDLTQRSGWFATASDERFVLILVQTLTDVDVIRQALPGTRVAACPYGYDPALFNPDFPEPERCIDVGCYFNLKGDPRRMELIRVAGKICARRGWSFKVVSGIYGEDYARLLRTTRVCLHRSEWGEIPFRIYEAACSGALFLTDPLGCGIETLFDKGREYLTYNSDLSDLEEVLVSVSGDPDRWLSIRVAARERVRQYSWPEVAERYVVPALRNCLEQA